MTDRHVMLFLAAVGALLAVLNVYGGRLNQDLTRLVGLQHRSYMECLDHSAEYRQEILKLLQQGEGVP